MNRYTPNVLGQKLSHFASKIQNSGSKVVTFWNKNSKIVTFHVSHLGLAKLCLINLWPVLLTFRPRLVKEISLLLTAYIKFHYYYYLYIMETQSLQQNVVWDLSIVPGNSFMQKFSVIFFATWRDFDDIKSRSNM